MTTIRHRRRRIALALVSIVVALACALGACSSTKVTTPGQLIIAIDTDMALPDQVDELEIDVTIADDPTPTVRYQTTVGGGDYSQAIPATLTLVAGPDPSVPATITLVGFKNGVPRTLRQVTSTVPTDRIVTLRMPIQWLCSGMVQPSGNADGGLAYQSSCGPKATCKAGLCVGDAVDPSGLPTYDSASVFGGGSAPRADGSTMGTCFETISCMIGGTIVAPDDPMNCTVAVPADTSNVNIALRVANNGICDTTGETCFVPLDRNSDEGWTIADGRAALPPAVCEKLRTGEVQAIVVSTTCPSKTTSTPACGKWSSVVQAPDSSVATALAEQKGSAPPSATLLASVVPDGGGSVACCPLLADSARLYTCTCDGKGVPQIVAIDPRSGGGTTLVGTFSPSRTRVAPYAAAVGASATSGSEFYWADRASADGGLAVCPVSVVGLAAAGGGSSSTLASVPGDVYDGINNLIADANDLYMLADDVVGQPRTIQLVRIDRGSGAATPLDTGGASAVTQLAQDPSAVYTIVDTVEPLMAGSFSITSEIFAFPKSGPSRSLLSQASVTSSDQTVGGFAGLADDESSLFVLYQSAPMADGTVNTQLFRIDPPDAGASVTWPPGAALYGELVDPKLHGSLALLGAVDGAAILVRDVTPPATDSGPALPSQSSLIVIPPGGGKRIVASFEGDRPIAFRAPSFTADAFWLNASGRVFRLPAPALR